MNRREKILAAIVAAFLVVAGLNFGTARVFRMFTDRSDRIAEIEEDLKSKEVMKHRGTVARRLLDVYEKRSLPSDPVLANSRYRAWLHDWVEKSNIQAANVKHVMTRPFRDSHDRHTFSVSCQADLPQLVQLLFEFYSTDYLHRIKHMSARPQQGKILSLAFTIEAVSLPKAEKDKELGEMPSQRLAFDNLDDYINVIVNRNLYSPANQPPTLADSGPHRGYLNQPMSIRPRADDPEENQVSFRLGEDRPDGMTIDEESGRIEWTPSEKGEFEVLVYAIDDGIPAKETSQAIRIEVTDPPPAEPIQTRPSFDDAKYTFVTGIVEVNGQRQVWLTIRTEGKWLRLREGDSFQVGSFEGKIAKIHPRHVEIESENTLVSVRYGQSINDGEILSEGAPDVASSVQ
jgi:hypothetical protein